MKDKYFHHVLFGFLALLIALAFSVIHMFQSSNFDHTYFHLAPVFIFATLVMGGGACLLIYIRLKKDLRITLEKLRLSEQRFKLAIDATMAAVWHYNLVTGEIDCSDQYYSMLGYQPKEFKMSRDKFFELLHPDDIKHVARTFNDYIDGTIETYQVDFRLRAKDGNWVWVLSGGKAIEWDEDGHPARIAGTNINITEEKKAKALLRKSEERYRLIVENMDQYIYVICEGEIVFATQNLSELMEPPYTLETLLNSIHDDDLESSEEHRGDMSTEQILNKRFSTDKIKFVLPDKTFRWMRVHSAHILWQGKSARLVCWRDITEHVEASERQTLLEKHLFETQKMNALAAMADGISRSYNNYIQVIGGNVELALSTSRPDEQNYQHLKKIESVLADSAELMDAFALFSHNDESSKQIIDLNLLLERLFKTLRCILPRNITIRYKLKAMNKIKAANPVEIGQAIMNLVLNARDAMPEGGHIIFYAYDVTGNATSDDSSGYVGLDVIDQGGGIDKEILPRIFEPFFTTKQKSKNLGLGLYMTYTIVHNNGGYIESKNVACGARFKLWFPAEISSAQLAEVIAFPIGGNETILLVDDNTGINTTTSDYLRRYGYHVISAYCAEEALSIYEDSPHKIDLVIVDLIMPGMGGISCIRELSKINPDVKIIVASGYVDNVFIGNEVRAIVKKIIRKPYLSGGIILNTVRNVLDAKM